MYDTYIIQTNDTIETISRKFETSPEVLRQLNGYMINLIPGNTLVVPRIKSDNFDYYTVNKGDSLYKIANANNIDANLLAQLNGINKTDYIYPNQTLLVPKAGTILYITGIGDTLGEIAKGLNIGIDKLISQNSNIYLQPEQLLVYKYK